MNLIKILEKLNPTILSNGQIRTKCPFTENHTGGTGMYSMFISPNISAYHCFSCKESGNLNRLLTSKFDIGYFEAAEYISAFASDVISGKLVTALPDGYEVEKPWELKTPKVFVEKGISEEVLRKFNIGITAEGETVIPFYFKGDLKGVQYRRDYVKDGEKIRTIANSKRFNKREYIYNYDPTKNKTVVIVEGYSDVFRLEMFGVHAVALLGSEISKEQAELLSMYKNIYIATDNDEAGAKCLEIINYRMQKFGIFCLCIPYIEKDPGDCESQRRWNSYMKSATDYFTYSATMAELDEDYLLMKNKVLKNAIKEY